MNLNPAPAAYERRDQSALRETLEQADEANLKRDRDIVLAVAVRLVLTAPDGTLHALTVDSGGGLSTAAYP